MKSVIVMGLYAVALAGAALSAVAEGPMLFNMVHHNPGEERWVTDFTEPRHLKEPGYTGQILAYGAQCGRGFLHGICDGRLGAGRVYMTASTFGGLPGLPTDATGIDLTP